MAGLDAMSVSIGRLQRNRARESERCSPMAPTADRRPRGALSFRSGVCADSTTRLIHVPEESPCKPS